MIRGSNSENCEAEGEGEAQRKEKVQLRPKMA
jgi:hypothetical protein